jgi:hypothetical protein
MPCIYADMEINLFSGEIMKKLDRATQLLPNPSFAREEDLYRFITEALNQVCFCSRQFDLKDEECVKRSIASIERFLGRKLDS